MKSSAQRMNALLKVREAELEAAVSRLLEKRSGLLEGLAKLKTLESEKKKASSEIAENAESHDPVLHGRFMARLRREALRLTKEITGLQETVDVARDRVKSAHNRHASVDSLITRKNADDLLKKQKSEERQMDGEACQQFVARELRGEAS